MISGQLDKLLEEINLAIMNHPASRKHIDYLDHNRNPNEGFHWSKNGRDQSIGGKFVTRTFGSGVTYRLRRGDELWKENVQRIGKVLRITKAMLDLSKAVCRHCRRGFEVPPRFYVVWVRLQEQLDSL